MISLSEIEGVKGNKREDGDLLILSGARNLRGFALQDIIKTLLVAKLPIGLRRIFK